MQNYIVKAKTNNFVSVLKGLVFSKHFILKFILLNNFKMKTIKSCFNNFVFFGTLRDNKQFILEKYFEMTIKKLSHGI